MSIEEVSFEGVPFAKGHGTGNDFVVIPDLEGRLELTPEMVRRICDRRFGIGGDGVLRIVRSSMSDDPMAKGADIFMDHRNADGSTAEMCGNGIRVFVSYLIAQGWVDAAGADIATRGGVRHVARRVDGLLDVAMGQATAASTTEVGVGTRKWAAAGVCMPNPHAVAFVDSLDDAGDLDKAPSVTPREAFPDGVNVEFVREIAPAHVQMRVHERGVGETQSCGTGACAVAWVARRRPGASEAPTYRVDVPGGTLYVEERADGLHLIGPAEIVAEGTLTPEWVARRA